MHRLGSIQVQYQTVLETSVFCRENNSQIPANKNQIDKNGWNLVSHQIKYHYSHSHGRKERKNTSGDKRKGFPSCILQA